MLPVVVPLGSTAAFGSSLAAVPFGSAAVVLGVVLAVDSSSGSSGTHVKLLAAVVPVGSSVGSISTRWQ